MKPYWKHLPAELKYLQPWAEKFGVRGLTIYNTPEPFTKYAIESELPELHEAYEAIAEQDVNAIIEWCHSIETGSPANDAREAVRGLLLLFERLAEYDLEPFIDGRVRYAYPQEEPIIFDWSRLPAQFQHLALWLKKYQHLNTEMAVYDYAADANEVERGELWEFKKLLEQDNFAFRDWCEANDVPGLPAKTEAFQAGWMFLMVHFMTWEKNADGTLKYPG